MDPMDDADEMKGPRLLVNLFLPACALLLAAFYLLMFRRDNAAPVVDLAGYRAGNDAGFQYWMDECRSNGRKVAAAGWVVREGHGASVRTVRLVLVDAGDGRARALKTTQLDRIDVSEEINRRTGGAVRYRNAGFVASLNLAAADPPVGPGTLQIAYDDGDARVLLPLRCRVEASR